MKIKLPSKYQMHQKFRMKLLDDGKIMYCQITSVHFHSTKIKYGVNYRCKEEPLRHMIFSEAFIDTYKL